MAVSHLFVGDCLPLAEYTSAIKLPRKDIFSKMHLTHLSLTNFRNFARLDIDIPKRSLLLVGDNAQGKTGIL